MDPKFQLGRVVATPGAIQALQEADQTPDHFLDLHVHGKWGDLCAEDRQANELAIAHEEDPEQRGRVFSAYVTRLGTKIWVITEWDRSTTTLLLPAEY